MTTASGLPALRRGRAATIYDIAELPGVSPSTVSRAERTLQDQCEHRGEGPSAVERLDSRVNPVARAPHTGRTLTLGVIVADIRSPMVFGFITGAEEAASTQGYTVVVAESQ